MKEFKAIKSQGFRGLGELFLEDATITDSREQTNIAVIQEVGHEEAWVIARGQKSA